MFIRVCGGRKKSEKFVSTKGTITISSNISGASIKVTSGSQLVVSDTMKDKSYTTAKLAPGEYEVEVTKEGYDPYKTTVKVNGDVTVEANLKESIVTGATATVSNALVDYKDTVLVNDNAIVTVTVKDSEGKVVPGKTVVFSIRQIIGGKDDYDKLEVKGSVVQTTDANGTASFVVGFKNTTTDCTETGKLASAEFTAKVLDVNDGTESAAVGCVGFAALDLATVNVDPEKVGANKGKLEVGENANNAGYINKDKDGISKTKSLNCYANNDVEYISTQKVSTEGKDEHEVTFDANPMIHLPYMATDNEKAKDFVQPVNEKSGDYFTYADNEYDKIIVIKEDTRLLQYATLIFNDIKVSKYTKLVITSYRDEKATDKIEGSEYEINGEHSQKGFGYQIPLNLDRVKAIKVSLKSAGQVQTNMNSGFDIDKIVGVYNTNSAVNGKAEVVSGAKITWENVDPVMSNFAKMSTTEAASYGIEPKVQTNTFDYQVPVFPYTGDAVIREFDSNDKVVTYYLVPTIKAVGDVNNDGKDDTNTNIIKPRAKAYLATAEEATTHKVGDIKTDGNLVKVNSSKVGSSNLKGTISLPTLGGDALDASNKYVYTSVQWNPIPKNEAVNSDAFLALAGQNINVYAQLVDKNGNPVSKKDQEIKYSLNDNKSGKTTPVDFTSSESVDVVRNKLKDTAVVKNTATDVHGKATLTLNSAQANVIDDLSASSKDYDVVLYIGKEKASVADLYWVNADLSFKKDVDPKTVEERTNNDTKFVETSEPKVATPWQYAVRTVGNTFVKAADVKAAYNKAFLYPGTLEGYDIKIDGLNINTTIDEDNKGTYKVAGNGVVNAETTREYKDLIINELNDKSVGENVTFTAKKGDDTKTYACVGEGSANLTAKMQLGVNWKAEGTKLAISSPAGTTISRNEADDNSGVVDLYVKVTDATGNNPKEGKTVKFTSGTATDKFKKADGTNDLGGTGKNEATTDGNGIAHVKLYVTDSTQKSSVITASVDGVDEVATTTINWEKYEKAFGLVNASVSSTDTKQVVLTFNNNVEAGSVKKDMFEISKGTKKFEITDAKASGKYVYLTLKNVLQADDYKVTISDTTIDSVKYVLSDVKGVEVRDKEANFNSEGEGKYQAVVSNYATAEKESTPNAGVATITLNKVKVPGDGSIIDTAVSNEATAEEAFAKNFVVTVDGKIQNILTTNKASKSINDVRAGRDVLVTATATSLDDATFTIQLRQTDVAQKVAIYFLGGSNTYTVQPLPKTDVVGGTNVTDVKDTFGAVVTAVDNAAKAISSSAETDIDPDASNPFNVSVTVKKVEDKDGILTVNGTKLTVASGSDTEKTAKFTVTFKYGDNETTIGYKVTRAAAGTITTESDDKTTVDTLASDLKDDSAKLLKTENLFNGTNTTILVSDLKALAKNGTTISVSSSATPDSYTFDGSKIVVNPSATDTDDVITLTIKKGIETATVSVTFTTNSTSPYSVTVS
ncbi:MAG: PEGA domain-containing protein [Lachnospiraceae bacterium]|nr:PEGA domain-containing protein [Lachnospiraceae bacterium]